MTAFTRRRRREFNVLELCVEMKFVQLKLFTTG
jgi:hypothetical protein